MGIRAILKNMILAGIMGALVGCAATQTALEHRTLETETKMSKTVFLDPVPNSQKTIYMSIKNTTDQDMNVTSRIADSLKSHGFKVTNNPDRAHYLLQANILKVGKMSLASSHTALGGGYGSSLASGVVGAATVGAFSDRGNAMLAGGLVGGAIGLAADSLVKDVNYTMITDIQVSERVGRGVVVDEQFNSELTNGSSSNTSQTYNKQSNFQRFRTRIVSNADQVNLTFAKARPALEAGLIRTISGIF